MRSLIAMMGALYAILAMMLALSLLTFGSAAIKTSIEHVDNPKMAWIAWIIVCFASAANLFGSQYIAFIRGVDRIALEQRWAAIFSFGSICTAIAMILITHNIYSVIISNQIWIISNCMRNMFLSGIIRRELGCLGAAEYPRAMILGVIWPTAWRSCIGVATSAGLNHLSGVVYAQCLPPHKLASYLLAIRFMNMISEFSRAPFYSKIPQLNMLRAIGDTATFVNLAKKGMRLSYMMDFIGIIMMTFAGPWIFRFLGSDVPFPSDALWMTLLTYMVIERYGSMHLQLFSTTNKIIWHKANGIAGVIAVSFSLASFPYLEVLAFPVGLIVGYGFFYSWYCSLRSYRSIREGFMDFEKTVALPFLPIFAFIGLLVIWF